MKFGPPLSDPMRKICKAAAESVYVSVAEGAGHDFALMPESPIEEIFAAAIFAQYRYISAGALELFPVPPEQFDHWCDDLAAKAASPYEEYRVIATNQYQIENARVDFCFCYKNWRSGNIFKLVVECDGHAYHERTKEQAMKDRARDRFLQQKGYVVFRFTGAEIWRSPLQCAEQVADWIDHKASQKDGAA